MSRPIEAIINHQALKHNLATIRRLTPTAKIWAVVKAGAYGHGLANCWPALTGADGFALLNLEEAVLLREQQYQKPILLLEGFFRAADLAIIDAYRLVTCIHSHWQIEALSSASLSTPIDIYVKVNSGLNRLGFVPRELPAVWSRLRAMNNVGKMVLMTHFAQAGEPNGVAAPLALMADLIPHSHVERSYANSAATLWYPQTQLDWVRIGILLYGASPTGRWDDIAAFNFRPAMTLKSEIIAIQLLSAGDGVGYGHRYRADEAKRIGIVACGYADGYPYRSTLGGVPISVDGVITRTLPNVVAMDMLAVDLTPCPQAHIGSSVELWGEQIKIDHVAATVGTISYELMCSVSARVPVRVE